MDAGAGAQVEAADGLRSRRPGCRQGARRGRRSRRRRADGRRGRGDQPRRGSRHPHRRRRPRGRDRRRGRRGLSLKRARPGVPLLAAVLVGGCGQGSASDSRIVAAPVLHASAEAPVVVEEFQSQGCSSCPPANANVNALAARPEVLALSYAVTYWDALGWKDTFDSPAFTQRQWDYAHHAGRANVATPQVIVNGGPAATGGDLRELEQLVEKEGSPKGGPAIAAKSGAVALASGKTPQPATVWLVRYDPQVR